MSRSVGKEFEKKFKDDWIRTVDSFIYRLNDQLSGYKFNSKNICDFICYDYPNLFLIECKTHKGASLPFRNITQYDDLIKFVGIKGIRVGIICWLYEKDIVLYIPISTVSKMKKDNKKSVGIKSIEDGYNIKVIPSKKKVFYMDSDYSILKDLVEFE